MKEYKNPRSIQLLCANLFRRSRKIGMSASVKMKKKQNIARYDLIIFCNALMKCYVGTNIGL